MGMDAFYVSTDEDPKNELIDEFKKILIDAQQHRSLQPYDAIQDFVNNSLRVCALIRSHPDAAREAVKELSGHELAFLRAIDTVLSSP